LAQVVCQAQSLTVHAFLKSTCVIKQLVMAHTISSDIKARFSGFRKLQIEIPTAEEVGITQVSSAATNELRVRNTFIDIGPSPSMDRFLRERAALSCPGRRVGQLEDLFGRSAYTLSSVPEPNVNKPAVISLMDSLADLPTMPCTPEPLNMCWQPFVHDAPARPVADAFFSSRELFTSLSDGAAGMTLQKVSYEAATANPGMLVAPAASEQLLPRFRMPDMAQMPSLELENSFLPAAPSQPAPGSIELPSFGSAGHALGECKPCAFLHTKGCGSGAMCKFCHLCDAGEKKRRQKEKKQAFRQAVH